MFHCGFGLHFPMISDVEFVLCIRVLVCYLCIFFGKMFIHSSAHVLIGLFVLFLILNCINTLYILDTNLYQTSFANIFSHSVDIFILSVVFFIVQKLLILPKSHLFFLLFSLSEDIDSKKYC